MHRRRSRGLLLTLAATLAALVIGVAPALSVQSTARVGRIVQITNDSNGDNEVDMATSPVDASVVIAGWNDYVVDDGCGYGWSSDGGRTWDHGLLRAAPRPDGGTYSNGADPGVAFDSQGRAYFSCLYYDLSGTGWGGSVYVYRSSDGGRTYPERILAVGSIKLSRSHDHPFITIDQATDTVYVAYSVFNGMGIRSRSYVVQADTNALAAGFSTPANVSNVTKNEIFDLTVDTGPAVTGGSGRTVYAVFGIWTTGSTWNEDTIAVARSTDGGRSFEKTVIVDQVVPMPKYLPGQGWRTGNQPIAAVDPSNGNHLWVVFGEYADGDGDLIVRESWDGGKTWSARRPVGETAPGSSQLYAWMSVSPDGKRLDLIYDDLGYDPAGYLVDLSYAASWNGGASWSRTRVTPEGFDANLFPPGSSPFIGDYIQIESFLDQARLAWTANGTQSTEIFTTTVKP